MNAGSTYDIQFSRAATKELRKLDKPVAKRVKQAIDALGHDPRPPGCRALTGHPGLWRIRAGDYRIVYTIRDNELVILVLRAAHRGSAFQNLPEQPSGE